MRKHDIVKTIQLIIFILLTAFGCYKIFTNHSLYHMIASDPDVRIMFALLWFVLGLSFFFIFLDFSFSASYKKDYRELDYAVHSDPLSGIANRYSCDALIEKYLDRPLPDTLGCIMFDLTNIREINTLYGHLQGNAVIRDFSNILKLASVNLCFVGRNGGNKFLAIFEDTTPEQMDAFLRLVNQRVSAYNSMAEQLPLKYAYGRAYHEGAQIRTITQLISLANQRISDTSEEV